MATVTSTSIINRFRPLPATKTKHMDCLKLICNASGFIQAIERGMQQGLI